MNTQVKLNIFKALSEESRFRIVELLVDGEKCACEIPTLIGRTQSNTSMHLSKLISLGVLESRREGKKILYSIKNHQIYVILKLLGDSPKIVSPVIVTKRGKK